MEQLCNALIKIHKEHDELSELFHSLSLLNISSGRPIETQTQYLYCDHDLAELEKTMKDAGEFTSICMKSIFIVQRDPGRVSTKSRISSLTLR